MVSVIKKLQSGDLLSSQGRFAMKINHNSSIIAHQRIKREEESCGAMLQEFGSASLQNSHRRASFTTLFVALFHAINTFISYDAVRAG
jgi:hypothetical protein